MLRYCLRGLDHDHGEAAGGVLLFSCFFLVDFLLLDLMLNEYEMK